MHIMTMTKPYAVSVKEKGPNDLRLEADYSFSFVDQDEVLRTLLIPQGFLYDGASVPRWAWSLTGFERRGVHDPASLVHDYLYEKKGELIDSQGGRYIYTRKDADHLFEKALQYLGIRSWHTRIAYLAVRGFGGGYWRD